MIKFTPEGSIGAFFDWLMRPIMFWLQGNWKEEPQRTHFWNNIELSPLQVINVLDSLQSLYSKGSLKTSGVSRIAADKNAVAKFSLFPIFHAPRFGGWKEFIVLEPVDDIDQWYVGWFSAVAGMSLVPIKGRVRVLIGPGEVIFFGVDKNGKGIPINTVDSGEIGKAGEYAKVPLL